MSEAEQYAVRAQIDQSIETYAERCRVRVPQFIQAHFSLNETWQLQRPTFWWDLAAGAFNSFWAVPFLTVRKVAEATEKLGYPLLAHVTSKIPSGIKTGYQRKVESIICHELLEWKEGDPPSSLPAGLTREFASSPTLQRFAGDRSLLEIQPLEHAIEKFSAARALVSDLSASLLTALIGWYYYGNSSLSVDNLAYRMAKKEARDQAASRFFLGRGVGSAFYRVFKPEPSHVTVWMFLVLLVAALTLAGMVCTLLSDPVRRALKLQDRKLLDLVDDVEKEIALFAHKHLKGLIAQRVAGASVERV